MPELKQVEIESAAAKARETFAGRHIWHVNSTAQGGGVAEMLRALLPYARDAGVDVRWLVLPETDGFFAVTKRIHNRLHGAEGDGGKLGGEARTAYEGALAWSAERLRKTVGPQDVIYLHDPQTAGLVPAMKEAGPAVIWRATSASTAPTTSPARPGTSSAPTSSAPTPTSSPGASTSGRGSTGSGPGSCRR